MEVVANAVAARRLSPRQQQRHQMLQNSNSARLMTSSPPLTPPTDRLPRVPYQMSGIHDQAFLLRARQALLMSPTAAIGSPPTSTASPAVPHDLHTYNDAYNRMKMVLAAASSGLALPQAPPVAPLARQTPSADTCRDPYCKDPYCSSRPNTVEPVAKSPRSRSVSRSPLTPGSRGSAYRPGHSPAPSYTCSWIAGGEYCGRKFPDGEALTIHLRCHTETAYETPTHHAHPSRPTSQRSPSSLGLPGSTAPTSLPATIPGLPLPLHAGLSGVLPSTLATPGIPGLPTGIQGLPTPLPTGIPGLPTPLPTSLPVGIAGLQSPLMPGIPGLSVPGLHALSSPLIGQHQHHSSTPSAASAPPASALTNPYAALGNQYAAYRAHLASTAYNAPVTSSLPASRYHPYAGKMHSLPSPGAVPAFYPPYGILPVSRHAAMP